MDYLPLFLDLNDRPCLVVGGGAVASRKLELLLAAGARIEIVAPALGAHTRRLVDEHGIPVQSRGFAPSALDGLGYRHYGRLAAQREGGRAPG